jgi:outer membrane protein assembly factor BamB
MTDLRIPQLALAACLALSACSHLPDWMGGSKKEIVRLPGERIAILQPGSKFEPDPTLKSLPVALPAVAENTEWTGHTGIVSSANANLALKGALKDTQDARAGGGADFGQPLVPAPVVGAGMVFAMDAEGFISAHDAANIGTVKWTSPGVSEKKNPEMIGGGLSYGSGKLYALSGRGVAAAFDAASGKELWRKTLSMPFRSAPTLAGDLLFAVTIDSQLLAINTATGDIVWNHRGIDETTGLMNSVSPAVARGVVVVPYASGEIYALSATDGKEIWTQSLVLNVGAQGSSLFSGIGGDPVIDGDVIFAVSNGGLMSVYSLVHGQRIWDMPVSSLNTPWVAGDYLFLLSSDNVLICMVKYDGRVRWSTKLASFENEDKRLRPIVWRGPVLVDNKLAVVSSNGQLTLVSADNGQILETRSVADNVFTPPIVAGGRMYLIDKGATLYQLQ